MQMDLKRRDFLKSSLAGLSGAAMGGNAISARASSWPEEKEPKNSFGNL
ncbi:MAG: twin-arginine translocation signal domain-containing protein, partial [Thermoguttaceae bacterium]|nr:twin-arginine translocation signal domain-containing protein [Thermoguttaceae bacterium]